MMKKEFTLPQDMLKGSIDEFKEHVMKFLDNSSIEEITFNFNEVNIIVSHSIRVIIGLIKTISVLGIKVRLMEIPTHLALPFSRYLDDIPNVTFDRIHRSENLNVTSEIDYSEAIEGNKEEYLLELIAEHSEVSIHSLLEETSEKIDPFTEIGKSKNKVDDLFDELLTSHILESERESEFLRGD